MQDTIEPRERMPRITIAAHWLSVLVILGAFASILSIDFFEEESAAWEAILNLHKNFGFVVFVLIFVRLCARITNRKNMPLVQYGSKAVELAAKAGHGLLYGLMLALVLLGILSANAQGTDTLFFGFIHAPQLIAPSDDLEDFFVDLHGSVAWTLAAAAFLHAAAALWHHYVKKDNVLKVMLPAACTAKCCSKDQASKVSTPAPAKSCCCGSGQKCDDKPAQ